MKAPVRGGVKSRLAAEIGGEAALGLYRSFVLDTLETLKKTGVHFRIRCAPPEAVAGVRAWLTGLSIEAQQGHDLGERMEEAFRRVFAEGVQRAVLIGSDIPDLPASIVTKAVDALETHDAVIGPAADGGYYLIGFNSGAFSPAVFHGIAWSTNGVFRETVNRARDSGLTVWRAPEWADVDTADDLRLLIERSRNTAFDGSATMTYITRNWDRISPTARHS